MGFHDRTHSPSSPVLILQSQHSPQPYSMTSTNHTFGGLPFDHGSLAASASWPQPVRQVSPRSAASRKRSREDAADDLGDDDYLSSTAPESSEEDWEYGEGMTLIKPNGFIIDASSQTVTWAEEKAELTQQLPHVKDRPALRSFKSQRLDVTATPFLEEVSLSNGSVVALSPPKTTAEDPTVDAFTIHLGIGWSRMCDDEHIQAAARGWARFIENHYPLDNVQIRLQSKGLASYLVEANEGWFLFAEDLKQGRLVATSLEKAFENLKTSPPDFDSDGVLVATAETPQIEIEAEQEVNMNRVSSHDLAREVKMNGAPRAHASAPEIEAGSREPTRQELEVEMDMSG